MPNLDCILAPRPLVVAEVISIIAPELITYSVAHRAFTHARLWFEDETEGATRHAAEAALEAIAGQAEASVRDWLADMDSDGEPRFFRNDGLKKAVRELCSASANIACRCESETALNEFIRQIDQRDPDALSHITGVAGA